MSSPWVSNQSPITTFSASVRQWSPNSCISVCKQLLKVSIHCVLCLWMELQLSSFLVNYFLPFLQLLYYFDKPFVHRTIVANSLLGLLPFLHWKTGHRWGTKDQDQGLVMWWLIIRRWNVKRNNWTHILIITRPIPILSLFRLNSFHSLSSPGF